MQLSSQNKEMESWLGQEVEQLTNWGAQNTWQKAGSRRGAERADAAFHMQPKVLCIWGRWEKNISRRGKDARLSFLFLEICLGFWKTGSFVSHWKLFSLNWYIDCRLPISFLSFPYKANLSHHEDSQMVL